MLIGTGTLCQLCWLAVCFQAQFKVLAIPFKAWGAEYFRSCFMGFLGGGGKKAVLCVLVAFGLSVGLSLSSGPLLGCCTSSHGRFSWLRLSWPSGSNKYIFVPAGIWPARTRFLNWSQVGFFEKSCFICCLSFCFTILQLFNCLYLFNFNCCNLPWAAVEG